MVLKRLHLKMMAVILYAQLNDSAIPWNVDVRLLCLQNFPGKNTVCGYHFPQGIFLIQIKPVCSCISALQGDSFQLSHLKFRLWVCKGSDSVSGGTNIIYD